MFKLIYLTLIFTLISTIAVAAPYQELAPKAGYVPVYIREGDTPLSEVNPKLVEAFHEDESAKIQLEVVSEVNEDNVKNSEDRTKEVKNKDDITAADEAKVENATASDIAEFDNIKSKNDDLEPKKTESLVEASE